MQPAAVHDADRTMTMTAALDELLDERKGFHGGLAMQVETVCRYMVAPFQPTQFAAVYTRRDVAGI